MSSNDLNKYENLVENLLKSGWSVSDVAEKLLKDDYTLVDIIRMKNAKVTEAYLNEKDSISYDDSEESIHVAMTLSDVHNVEVLLFCGPATESRRNFFVDYLILMTTNVVYRKLKVVKVFVEQISKWHILDKSAVLYIESNVFQRANKNAVQTYLECNFDVYAEKLLERSILPSIFSNPNKNVIELLFKERNFDLNAFGADGFTALHWAAKSHLLDHMKFLLDRGAEPNSLSSNNDIPLACTMFDILEESDTYVDPYKCVELLLQYGGDMLYHNSNVDATFVDIVFWYEYTFDLLGKLVTAHLAIHEANGRRIELLKFNREISSTGRLHDFYTICQEQLEQLKNHEINDNRLTMFAVVSLTGKMLFELIDEKDRIIISAVIKDYIKDCKLHVYYVSTLREHLRQFDNLIECLNKAKLIISESCRLPLSYDIVLRKITNYLNYYDLVKFQ